MNDTLTDSEACALILQSDPFQSGLDVGIEIDVDLSGLVTVDSAALQRLAARQVEAEVDRLFEDSCPPTLPSTPLTRVLVRENARRECCDCGSIFHHTGSAMCSMRDWGGDD